MKARTIDDLNENIVVWNREWARGVLEACNLVNSTYSGSSHKYLLGDCVLAKLNLLARNKKIRTNKASKRKAGK